MSGMFATWPQSTVERFLKDIEDLLNKPLPQNTIIPDFDSEEDLKALWREWLQMMQTFSISYVLTNR